MKNLQDQLRKITDEIENEVSGNVSLGELFDLGFLEKNSDFKTLHQLFRFHDIVVEDIDDFEALDIEVLDKAVKASTSFGSWDEMLRRAEEEHIIWKLKNVGFDISE